MTCAPGHHNGIAIKIDRGTETQAAYQHIIYTQWDSANPKFFIFYSDSSLHGGKAGAKALGIRADIITV